MKNFPYLLLICALALVHPGFGQRGEAISFPLAGKVKPRHSHEIAASNWSIGGETMDRDYTDFDQWKQ